MRTKKTVKPHDRWPNLKAHNGSAFLEPQKAFHTTMFPGHFTGHEPTRGSDPIGSGRVGSGQEVLKISPGRVESGGFPKPRGSGRVGSGGAQHIAGSGGVMRFFKTSWVESGQGRRSSKYHWVESGQEVFK